MNAEQIKRALKLAGELVSTHPSEQLTPHGRQAFHVAQNAADFLRSLAAQASQERQEPDEPSVMGAAGGRPQMPNLQDMIRALRFYANRLHFLLSEEGAWDTVTGEPPNFWCDEAGTATVEDGTIAAMALRGEHINWDEEDDPPPLSREIVAAPPQAPQEGWKPEWVVNDNAELGVKVGDRFFFMYKGRSLEYSDGKHDDGSQMMWRPIGKREFGECCHPVNYQDPKKWGTVSLDDSDEWKPIAAAQASQERKEPVPAPLIQTWAWGSMGMRTAEEATTLWVRYEEYLRAWERTAPQEACVIAPLEPTIEMIKAGCAEAYRPNEVRTIYKDMLAAAPKGLK